MAGQYLGSKRPDDACKTCDQLLNLTIVLSLAVMAIMYLGRGFILNGLFGRIEPDVKAYANTYLLIVFAAIPFLAIYNCGAAMFRAMGNTYECYKCNRKRYTYLWTAPWGGGCSYTNSCFQNDSCICNYQTVEKSNLEYTFEP